MIKNSKEFVAKTQILSKIVGAVVGDYINMMKTTFYISFFYIFLAVYKIDRNGKILQESRLLCIYIHNDDCRKALSASN